MSDLSTILQSVPLENLLAELRRRRHLIEAEESSAELRIRSRAITRACAAAWQVPTAALWRSGRPTHLTEPRQAAMVLMRQKLAMTFEDIGAVFNKDHGTAMHALKTHPARLQDPHYAACFDLASSLLTSH